MLSILFLRLRFIIMHLLVSTFQASLTQIHIFNVKNVVYQNFAASNFIIVQYDAESCGRRVVSLVLQSARRVLSTGEDGSCNECLLCIKLRKVRRKCFSATAFVSKSLHITLRISSQCFCVAFSSLYSPNCTFLNLRHYSTSSVKSCTFSHLKQQRR